MTEKIRDVAGLKACLGLGDDVEVSVMGGIDESINKFFVLFEKDQKYLEVMVEHHGHVPYIDIEGPEFHWSTPGGPLPLDSRLWWNRSGSLLDKVRTQVIQDRDMWNNAYRTYVEALEAKFK